MEEQFLIYDQNTDWQEIVDFVGEGNLPICTICGGSGEYETEWGTKGCNLCNSRCFELLTINGKEVVDWGDKIIKTEKGIELIMQMD